MIGVVCIYLTAWGVTGRLPKWLRLRIAHKTLRTLMLARGVPVDDYSDDELEAGVRAFDRAVRQPSLDMAPNLRDIIRDEANHR